MIRHTRPAAEPAPGPGWRARLLWCAIGVVAGLAIAIPVSLAVLSWKGPVAGHFAFRFCAYSLMAAGIEYGGDRSRWRRALLTGFGVGAGMAIARLVFTIY